MSIKHVLGLGHKVRTRAVQMGPSERVQMRSKRKGTSFTYSSPSNTVVNGVLTMPADTVVFTSTDGDYAPSVSLPAPASKRRRLWVQCRSTYPIVIKTTNTNLVADLSLTTGQEAMFVSNGASWIWRPVSGFPRSIERTGVR